MSPEQPNPVGDDSLDGTKNAANSLESLESSSPTTPQPAAPPPPIKKSVVKRILGLVTSINIYLLIFIMILAVAAIVFYLIFQASRRHNIATTSDSQTITSDTLNKLKNTDVSVGDVKQTLNIESNAVFGGKVLVRDGLDVAGSLKVGGSISLGGLSVAGKTSLDQIQGNDLAISGNTSIQGQVSIQKGLSVSGNASFGGAVSTGSVTTNTLQLLQDLSISRHIVTTGAKPGVSNGPALGSGGTVAVSGTDTAGTMTANTSNSPASGCFATINFSQAYNNTPHVVVTPTSSNAGGLAYYINRSKASFSICAANVPGSSQTFSFDYIVLG
jgi:cytoskeletal protein CcmA (bactofilin family)